MDYGELAELAEGARLLSEYMGKTCIEGSNPSLSAIKPKIKAHALKGCAFIMPETELSPQDQDWLFCFARE